MERNSRAAGLLGDDLAGDDEDLLVGEGDRGAGADRGEGRRDADAPDRGEEDEVGLGQARQLVEGEAVGGHVESVDGRFDLRRDWEALLRAPAENVFMIKARYWIGF